MSIFSLCERFVEECCADEYYALNVLYEFVKDNDKRIAVDRIERRLLILYAEVCRKRRSRHMAVWLKALAANQNRNIELITLDGSTDAKEALCVQIARLAPPPHRLIVWSLADYPEAVQDANLVLLDRELAKTELSPSNISHARGGSSKMARYEIKTGHNSNIVIGSQVRDSIKYLSSNVSDEAAKLLADIYACIEASGSDEAGEIFDKVTNEINEGSADAEKVEGYLNRILALVPDVAKIMNSAKEAAEILFGCS